MGDWYDYDVRLADKNKNIVEELKKAGYAEIVTEEGREKLKLFIGKLFEAAKKENFYKKRDGSPLEWAYAGQTPYDRENDKPAYCYTNKWAPDDTLAYLTSIAFPNEIVEVTVHPPYSASSKFFFKEGIECNKIGQPVVGLYKINSNLIKKLPSGDYKVSFPIGDAPNVWGSYITSEENISSSYSKEPANSVMFPVDKDITLKFNFGTKTYKPTELIDAYYKYKMEYRDKMREMLTISGLSWTNVTKKENPDGASDYYIVKIPTMDGYISITAPEFNVNEQTGEITLGERGKSRNARIYSENGRFVEERRLTHEEIFNKYNEYHSLEAEEESIEM